MTRAPKVESDVDLGLAAGKDCPVNIKTGMFTLVEGLIVTRDPPLALANPRYPKVRLGFGHSAMAPAEIIIKRITGKWLCLPW